MATIATVYWRSNEESVEGDKPQKAPVLESRETLLASNSRADRVQGKFYGYFENLCLNSIKCDKLRDLFLPVIVDPTV